MPGLDQESPPHRGQISFAPSAIRLRITEEGIGTAGAVSAFWAGVLAAALPRRWQAADAVSTLSRKIRRCGPILGRVINSSTVANDSVSANRRLSMSADTATLSQLVDARNDSAHVQSEWGRLD